jgi:hypothetical protein
MVLGKKKRGRKGKRRSGIDLEMAQKNDTGGIIIVDDLHVGYTAAMLPEGEEIPQSDAPIILVSAPFITTGGATGGSGGSSPTPISVASYYHQRPNQGYWVPSDNQQAPFGWLPEQSPQHYGWQYTPYRSNTTDRTSEEQPNKKKKQEPKYTQEEMKGKFVAYATIIVDGIEHTGVLFVRKCGAWKLFDCISMVRVAGGSQGSVLPEHKIHYYIYSEEFSAKQRGEKQKNRFDTIEA